MNTEQPKVPRRNVLLTLLAGSVAALSAAVPKLAHAQEKASLIAKRTEKVPTTTDDAAWRSADALSIPMAPQVVVKPRRFEVGVKAILLRALYDADKLALLLEWKDTKSDTLIGAAGTFRDAVALQFPAKPADGIPYFAMGEPNKPVTIYQWKADWQFAREHDVEKAFPNLAADVYPFSGRAAGEVPGLADYGKAKGEKAFHTSWASGSLLGDPELQARTSVEKLWAEGFGTITSAGVERQDASGQGEWKDGIWKVLISIPRDQDAFSFEPGMTVPIAFAAWDGARGERGGEKAVSTWYFMSLERPVGSVVYWGPLLALIGAAGGQALWLRYLHRKARSNTGTSG